MTKKKAISTWSAIVMAVLAIVLAVYWLYIWEVDFNELRSIIEIESEVIDTNLDELWMSE